jgi:hypothetical protein
METLFFGCLLATLILLPILAFTYYYYYKQTTAGHYYNKQIEDDDDDVLKNNNSLNYHHYTSWLVQQHNRLRAEGGLQPLKWSAELEKEARHIAQSCILDHSTPTQSSTWKYENLCYPRASVDTGTGIQDECMKMIADEKKTKDAGQCQDDRYGGSSGFRPCGHYEALMDPSLTHMAFALSPCTPKQAQESKYTRQFGADVHVNFGVFLFK